MLSLTFTQSTPNNPQITNKSIKAPRVISLQPPYTPSYLQHWSHQEMAHPRLFSSDFPSFSSLLLLDHTGPLIFFFSFLSTHRPPVISNRTKFYSICPPLPSQTFSLQCKIMQHYVIQLYNIMQHNIIRGDISPHIRRLIVVNDRFCDDDCP